MGSEVGAPLRFGVLGPLQVVGSSGPVALGGIRQRALLALLLVHSNELVRIDQLVDALFDDRPREAAVSALRVAILRLRRALGDDEGRDALRTHPGGYVLTTGAEQLDLDVFERRLHDARGQLAARQAGAAGELLHDALSLWRGPALADLALMDCFQGEIRRLEGLRLLARMERVDADLALGRAPELIPEIESLVAAEPLQERLRAQLMLALYRAGRQADALAVYRETSKLLSNELGLAPSRALQELERSILDRDDAIDAPAAQAAMSAGGPAATGASESRPDEQAEITAVSETRYARSGDVHIAYQVVTGSGAVDLVAIPPGVSNIDVFWEQPVVARFLRGLASFSRMAIFDKRGSGMSDRSIGHPSLEDRMDDTRAVMDAIGMQRAAVVGHSHGGPMAMLFAATYPERISSLVLFGTFARLLNDDDFTLGSSREQVDEFVDAWAARWGTPETLTPQWYCPSMLGDEQYRRWVNRFERQSATPADLHAMVQLDCEIDVRHVLGAISVPTLVIHRTGDRINRVEQARWIAEQIPGAEYLELPGEDHFPYAGDQDAVVAAIEQFVTGRDGASSPERVLATILITDVDDRVCEQELARYDGRRVNRSGAGLVATFDGPARGIRCAMAIRAALGARGLDVRAGLHAGECDRHGDTISGTAVDIAARIAALAAPGEVLVSRTVSDLIAGSRIALLDRGEHELSGVTGSWRVYGVDATPSPAA